MIQQFLRLATPQIYSSATDSTPISHIGHDYLPAPPNLPATATSELTSVSESRDGLEPESGTMEGSGEQANDQREFHEPPQGQSHLGADGHREVMQMLASLSERLDQMESQQHRSLMQPPFEMPSTSASAASADITAAPKASEIGYFFPNMPLDWGDKDVVEKDGKLYYQNVYSFTNWIRVVAQTRDIAKLKQTLDTCLRGEAELWWNNQLNHIMRLGYLAAPSLDHYCEALEARFCPPPSEALAKFNTT